MAKRHLVGWYVEQQAQYNKMLDIVKQLEESYQKGNMDFDRYSQLRDRLVEDIEKEKANYEMASYVMFLLNIPNRVKKEDRYLKENKMYLAYLDRYSKESMTKESEDILKDIKEKIKQFEEETHESR